MCYMLNNLGYCVRSWVAVLLSVTTQWCCICVLHTKQLGLPCEVLGGSIVFCHYTMVLSLCVTLNSLGYRVRYWVAVLLSVTTQWCCICVLHAKQPGLPCEV